MRLNRQRVCNALSCLNIFKSFRAAAIAVLALVLSFPSFCVQFQELKISEGQRQTSVFSITEDNDGYLWLGTLNGLYRFDGKNFINYQNQSEKPNSLSNNLARLVYTASDGQLWIGTQKGLNRYIPKENAFQRYFYSSPEVAQSEVIWGLFESPSKRLLVSTDTNLYWWSPDEDKFEPVLPSGTAVIEVKSLAFLTETRFLAATYDNGLYLVNAVSGKVQPYSQNGELSQPGQLIHQIRERESGYFELSTSHGIYNISAETWELSKSAKESLENLAIRGILQADDGVEWFATEQGLFTQEVEGLIREVPLDALSTPPLIYTLFKDSHGNMWVGGYSFFGMHRASSSPFNHTRIADEEGQILSSEVLALSANRDGSWVLNGANQLLYLNKSNNESELVVNLPQDISFEVNAKISSSEDDGMLWISSTGSILSFDKKTRELIKHTIQIDGVPLGFDYDFTIDPSGYIWLASKSHGLLKYNPDNGHTIQFIPKERNLSNFQVQALAFDPDGILWLGSRQGAFSFSTESETFTHHNLGYSAWVSALAASEGGIWIGTIASGLIHLDQSLGTVQRYTSKNGLIDNTICSIQVSTNGDVWLSTNHGLTLKPSESSKIRSFSYINSHFEAEYHHKAGALSPDGEIYFGGVHGVTHFYPQKVEPVTYKGKVHLYSLKVLNQEVLPNGLNRRLEASIDSLLPIRLLSSDSPFSIEFGYPSPAHSDSIVYRYRLKGLDHQWLNTNNERPIATYTNLSSGDYIFEVQAQSIDGQWQSQITRVPVYIAPPFWLSNWAYALYSLLLLTLLFILNRHRRQKKRSQMKIAESEERLKLSLWGSGDELWDWHITTGKIYRSNIWGLLEFPHDGRRSPAKDNESNIHPRDLGRVQKALSNHFDGESTYYEATYRVRNKSSDWLWILDRGKIVERDGEGKPLRMTGTIKDISKLKQAEHRLALFARSVANISDAVFILNSRFRIIEVNDAFTTITGFDKNQVVNSSLRFRSYPARFTEQVKMKLSQQGRWMGELQEIRKDGSSFYLELAIDPIASEEGEVTHYVGVFSDITRRKQTEEELKKLSVEDTLTGLPNRSWFQAEHAKLVAKKTRHALMVFDLDNFKKINDSLGHQAGDELLIQVAERLERCTRQQDTLFRLGGDEYAVLMENTTDVNAITQSVKSLQQALEKPFTISDQELVTTCSFGIVLFPLDGNDSEELLRNADTAMYHAKSQGSNGYVFFSSKMNESAKHQLHIESILRKAIRDDHFNLYYQPKFSAASGDIDGMEALIRLHHPEHGPISPGEFIPMAEENGLIIEIGDIVLKKACFAAQNWRRQELLKGRVAVNVSARQFASIGFIERIEHALKISGLPAHCLELELTEGALVEDPEGAIEVMEQVRQLGIHISLDDFGTGYSSLAYLQRFPIDKLKIDQTFVRNMCSSDSGQNMVSSIIALAHNLHLTVIAEGVETEQERKLLAQMRCETLQGYLMSRPLSETDFSAFLYIQQNESEQQEVLLEAPHSSQD